MYSFSKTSMARLNTCHPDLIKLMLEAIKTSSIDFCIICGYRDKIEQDKAYEEGKSSLKFPYSKHNSHPCTAVDIAPYPIDWNDINRFKLLRKHIFEVAAKLKIKMHPLIQLKNGVYDYPHIELA